MSLILTLHMESEWDAGGRLKGQRDIPLSVAGLADAERLAADAAQFGVTRIVSSDLTRSKQTAEVIARVLSVPMQCDERLRECAFGCLEGCTAAEAMARFGASARSTWESGYLAYDFRPFGGERRDAVFGRHYDALCADAGDAERMPTLIVGHQCGLNTFLAGIGEAPTLARGEFRTIANFRS